MPWDTLHQAVGHQADTLGQFCVGYVSSGRADTVLLGRLAHAIFRRWAPQSPRVLGGEADGSAAKQAPGSAEEGRHLLAPGKQQNSAPV